MAREGRSAWAAGRPPLHRHQLAHLSADGWAQVLARPWDADALPGLRHWASNGWPLVVTCQPAPRPDPQAPVALALAAPPHWPRRRLALHAAPAQIAWFTEFPTLAQALVQLPRAEQAPLRQLDTALRALDVRARVYGSAGWQHLTALPYLHARSDLDLWLPVDDEAQADRVTGLLRAWAGPRRLDGELVFPQGGAVAWREWEAVRAGRCRSVLVKRLHGAALQCLAARPMAGWPVAA